MTPATLPEHVQHVPLVSAQSMLEGVCVVRVPTLHLLSPRWDASHRVPARRLHCVLPEADEVQLGLGCGWWQCACQRTAAARSGYAYVCVWCCWATNGPWPGCIPVKPEIALKMPLVGATQGHTWVNKAFFHNKCSAKVALLARFGAPAACTPRWPLVTRHFGW